MRYVVGGGELWLKTGAAATAWTLIGCSGVNPYFGAHYQSAVQESRTSTTNDSASPAVKTTLTTPALPTGVYLVNWTATLDADNKIYECDLYNLTDTTILQFAKNKTQVSTYRWIEGGFALVTFLGVAKTFQIRWYNEAGRSDTLYIQRARITIWRVI
jgi:hypothetical protein